MKLLIENNPNSLKQVAQIDEDIFNYKMEPMPPQGRNFDQFLRQLEKNVDNFDAVDESGNTALHIAVQQGKLKRNTSAFLF